MPQSEAGHCRRQQKSTNIVTYSHRQPRRALTKGPPTNSRRRRTFICDKHKRIESTGEVPRIFLWPKAKNCWNIVFLEQRWTLDTASMKVSLFSVVSALYYLFLVFCSLFVPLVTVIESWLRSEEIAGCWMASRRWGENIVSFNFPWRVSVQPSCCVSDWSVVYTPLGLIFWLSSRSRRIDSCLPLVGVNLLRISHRLRLRPARPSQIFCLVGPAAELSSRAGAIRDSEGIPKLQKVCSVSEHRVGRNDKAFGSESQATF